MNIYDFGMAPRAKSEGYDVLVETVVSKDSVLQQNRSHEDVVYVRGPTIHGRPGYYEFGRFERSVKDHGTQTDKYLDPDGFAVVVVGREYEFYAEMQQAELPAHERMRNYTGQKVTVISGPLPKDPETSDLFIVRAADGREFQAYVEELSGWDKALGQYFWPDGAYGPERDLQFLCNEQKGRLAEQALA